MVQPTSKRLVTEAKVAGHVLTSITSPGATKDAFAAEISDQIATPGTPAATALSATIDEQVAPVAASVAAKLDTAELPNLNRALTAVSTISSKPVNALHLGDSITEGAGASGVGLRWVDLLRDDMRSKYQPYDAAFATIAGGPSYVKAKITYPTVVPFNWVLGGGATAGSANGEYIGSYYANLDAAGETLTLTFTGTAIKIFYTNYNASGTPSLPVTIDGAPVAAIGPFNNNPTNDAATATYTGLAPGSHTIVISHPGGNTNAYRIHGGLVTNGDENAGWRTWEGALSGSTVFVAGLTKFSALVKRVNPDIATVYYGTNEYRTNVAVATFKTRLENLVDTIRVARPRPAIVLIQGYKPAHAGTPVAAWSEYRAAVAEVAAAKGTLLTDLQAPFGGPGIPTTYLTDNVHPTDAGHALIKEAVKATLKL